MPLKTIMITNRKVKNKRSKGNGLFGNGIDEDSLHVANLEQTDSKSVTTRRKGATHIKRVRRIEKLKKTYKLTYIEPQDHDSYFQSMMNASDSERPWVLFLHGNNQTPQKNLEKSRKIQELYDVNMIIFSWPSRSYDDKMLKYLGASAVSFLIPGAKSLSMLLLRKSFKRKVTQYRRARALAVKTAGQFAQACQMLESKVFSVLRARNQKISLLTHSLGHKVLRDGIQKLGSNKFDSIVLHQADEEVPAHSQWVASLPVVNGDLSNIAITKNEYDAVLFLSSLVNTNFDVSQPQSRLGNRKSDSHDDQRFNNLDFTGGKNVWMDHELAWDSNLDPKIKNTISALLT